MHKYMEIEGQAKNINDALANALQKAVDALSMPSENLTYELIEQGKIGLFGLGGVMVRLRVSYEVGLAQKADTFLKELFRLMRLDAKLLMKEMGESIDITLEGKDTGMLIGRHGETLDALQYLTGLAVNKGEENHVRVNINMENYREKRNEALEKLAKKTAEKAIKYKRSFSLEPMSPQERRVIHTVLQNFPGVNTYSVGQEKSRRVIVASLAAVRGKEEGVTPPPAPPAEAAAPAAAPSAPKRRNRRRYPRHRKQPGQAQKEQKEE